MEFESHNPKYATQVWLRSLLTNRMGINVEASPYKSQLINEQWFVGDLINVFGSGFGCDHLLHPFFLIRKQM